ncbi:hypothetical protein C8R44DRAFT_798258 [Mycena epipterygia]|nr:hypothetical protein C8R44DRAFT_798258 [Mycena epipterygia]
MVVGGGWPWVFATLSTITASSRILKIIIGGYLDSTTPELFDSQLAGLPISPTFEFEMYPEHYAGMIPALPLLRSKNMLRCIDHDPEWFGHLTGMPI